MIYTVKQLAQLSGISVRTLHYYDEFGLLKPSFCRENKYRYYEQKELIRLQQILFFKELDFPLVQIKEMLDAPNFDHISALEDQKKLIKLKKDRLENLIQTINNSIKNMKNNTQSDENELYGSLTKKQIEKYKQEVRDKYGKDNPAVRQSEERTKNWTKQDYKQIEEEGIKLTQAIAATIDFGAKSNKTQKLIQKHYEGINVFYDCSLEMYRGLGQMYIQDSRFTAYYEKFKKGLAQFMCDAIAYYCDVKEKSK